MAVFNLSKNERTIRRSNNECYDYAKADWVKYKQIQEDKVKDLLEIDDSLLLKEKLEELIQESANHSIPTVRKSDRIENLPGYLVSIIKVKNYWRRRFYRYKSKENKENYYCLKELVNIVFL